MILSTPMRINSMQLRNRIVMPPMATGKTEGGAPTDELVSYYAARAGATGLIIVEHEYVSPEGMAGKGQLSMATDDVIGAYRRLTGAAHERGAKVLAQISHAGAQASGADLPALGPSAVTWGRLKQTPQEMTQADIDRVVARFAEAAARALVAGFDGVEVHAAHGYLLNQFYSPISNHRTDAYVGSTLEGRTRLHRQVLSAVREAVGDAYPVAIRFGACDYQAGGSAPEDVGDAARIFEDAGADLIDITGGLNGYIVPGHREPGWFADLSNRAKAAASVPVLLTGGITAAADAERLLEDGACDLVGVGRAMMRNPTWSEGALAR